MASVLVVATVTLNTSLSQPTLVSFGNVSVVDVDIRFRHTSKTATELGMGMAVMTPLTPGCIVVWFDHDVANYALVIQFSSQARPWPCHVVTVLKDQCLKIINLYVDEQNVKWRALRGT